MIYNDFGFREKIKAFDFPLALAAAALSFFGFLCISEVGSQKQLYVQLFAILSGIILMLVLSMINYEYYTGKAAVFLFALSAIVLAATLFIGTGDGNKSWINIKSLPFSIQPSEFVKLFFIITLAAHIDRVKGRINSIRSFAGLLLHALIISGLVMLQGDLGSALVFLFIFIAMTFCAGLSMWYYLGMIAVSAALSPLIWNNLKYYQQQRILVGFNPELDPLGFGYQPVLSKNAISAGGLYGTGLGNTAVAKTIPYAYTDIIFGVVGEVFGFLGFVIFFILISAIILRLLRLSGKARKDSGSYICAGVAAILIAQTLENAGMCMGILPVIGITLPFMSYGGSSILSLFMALGVALSVGTHRKKYYFEREDA